MVSQTRHRITHALHRAEEWIFANPKIVLALILVITALFGAALPKLRIYSDFADLLPQNHPYIQTYNRLKENFGGANMIVMAVEVEKGTILGYDRDEGKICTHPLEVNVLTGKKIYKNYVYRIYLVFRRQGWSLAERGYVRGESRM
jgi:hypothetical protein